ncbi:MAG TPA: nicotinic acid mononucleotide adenylyltransferase [Cyanobacteria bacterium UBA11149]|nr:nicotinic acid mononucleotide adenylyltransferase [Cyanobacteria bacterium UBA11367]HBE60270.1 nicotinic acid mononucleotide adenylyltransferase [Cyanobacteria bacterium UBA11366]HBK62216.1 nicotinic acid mononucleotide adenylyltransferase [Cyanobacteria bacterium UBA11166]HBR74303.1 nicotinic acid mononucleotide adenylyltransferase [Cyanobacteria bacterium UBA11159]HBS68519.1 nicotinic acid mononucleotide adenylyltransferase [Cyanobacteria bacterium UBA11153]HBW90705.1 nicotinic acid monon
MKNIALFGTSADPPTAAHQAIMRWLANRYDWVAVWASNNPFKSHQTSLEHRHEMLGLLIGEIETPRQNIRVYEELSSSRSLETVGKAKEIWVNGEQFILVIGADLVTQMPRWYRIGELLQEVELLVVPRLGYEIKERDLEELRQLGATVAIADLNAPPVSSTAYRENGDRDALTPPVAEYIYQAQLYACQKGTPSR